MKKYFLLGVLLTVLSGCGMPVIKKSWEGMGNSDMRKILYHTRLSTLDSLDKISWESKIRQHIKQYCEEKHLNHDLQICLSKMGMTCESNLCHYKGFYSTLTGGFLMFEERKKVTNLIKIRIDTDKGVDSLALEQESIFEMVKPTLWGY